jgi:inosose dehydratase
MTMFDRDKIHFAIMPTCWTNDDFRWVGDDITFEQCVSEIALAGFEGCSVGHKFPPDMATLKRELDLRGLQVSEPWVSLYFTNNDMADLTIDAFRKQIEFISAMGGERIVVAELGNSVHQLTDVAVLPNKPVFDDEQWTRLVDGLHEVGKLTKEAGLELCYHHHMGSGVQTRAEVDRLMAATDPELVHLLLDTGHLLWGGDDPLELARAHADRIRHVHLKDIRQPLMDEAIEKRWSFYDGVMAGVFTVPGDGCIDFVPILQTLADSGYEGWFSVEAEQDPKKANPLEYALRARSYLREVVGF